MFIISKIRNKKNHQLSQSRNVLSRRGTAKWVKSNQVQRLNSLKSQRIATIRALLSHNSLK